MPKIAWLGTPLGCPCFWGKTQVTDETVPDAVGQFYRPVSTLSPVPRLTRPGFFPGFGTYPQLRVPTCNGAMGVTNEHQHSIVVPRYPYFVIIGTVLIPRADVDLGAVKTYTSDTVDDHLHTLTLTSADFSALRAGRTLTKQTSRDARQGGRQHTHTVTVRCARTQVY
jgi:hypothetical protein